MLPISSNCFSEVNGKMPHILRQKLTLNYATNMQKRMHFSFQQVFLIIASFIMNSATRVTDYNIQCPVNLEINSM